MSAELLFTQALELGGAPLQLAALAWVVFRVEQLHRDSKALERRVAELEARKTAELVA